MRWGRLDLLILSLIGENAEDQVLRSHIPHPPLSVRTAGRLTTAQGLLPARPGAPRQTPAVHTVEAQLSPLWVRGSRQILHPILLERPRRRIFTFD